MPAACGDGGNSSTGSSESIAGSALIFGNVNSGFVLIPLTAPCMQPGASDDYDEH
jgi:hypothetical protein